MELIIVTGMSGAGKSVTLKFLEDLDYFCIDNLPPMFLEKFCEFCTTHGTGIKKVAIGIDIRGGSLFDDFFRALGSLEHEKLKILFLEANDAALIKRFKETRRIHPLSRNDRINMGILQERSLLKKIKEKADIIIDTSTFLTNQLKEEIVALFVHNKKSNSLMITVLSFGYKYGIPLDSDLVFDVRFIPNPFYIDELKQLTGNDPQVYDYVMDKAECVIFIDKLKSMLDFLIPSYIKEGKNQLVISIGCTGGKHRSVVIANEIVKYLKIKEQSARIEHRDFMK